MLDRLARTLAIVALTLTAACGGSDDEHALSPFSTTCPAGFIKGRTVDWVNLRSEPSTASADKTLVAPQTPLCLAEGEGGQPEVITGSTYDAYNGSTLVGTDNRWYRLTREGAIWFVAAHYVALGSDAPATGPKAVIYIQPLSDGSLSSLMAARQDVEVAIDGAAKVALKAMHYTAKRQAFLDYVKDAIERVEGSASSIAVVISGHSVGPALWGDYGRISDEDLADLAQQHPDFAAKVRHLFLLGCNTGWRPTMDNWRAPFPGILSVTGYAGKAPGGVPAYRTFEQTYAIVGDLTDPVLAPSAVIQQLSQQQQAIYTYWAFMIVSRGISTWDALKNDSLDTARSLYKQTRPVYETGWLAASSPAYADPPQDTHSEVVGGVYTPRKHYNSVQTYRNALVQALNAGSGQVYSSETWGRVAQLEQEMDQAIRLVFFRMCKDGWLDDSANAGAIDSWLAGPNADAIREAHNAALSSDNPATSPLGSGALTRTMIGKLTRMESNRFVEELESRIPSAAMVKRVRRALVELDADEIKDSYIE